MPAPELPPSTPSSSPRSLTQAALRPANLAAVMRQVLAAKDPLSRAQVAATLGMTRSTASRLVDELVVAGLLSELEVPTPAGRGRPATPLSGASSTGALGLQVNTRFLCARVLNLRGDVVAETLVRGDFRASRSTPVLQQLNSLAEQVLDELDPGFKVVGSSVALPGIVDPTTGTLLVAPNLDWHDVSPGAVITAGVRPDRPLLVGNEADMAARAVADLAPGRPGDLQDFFYVSGETGIGGVTVLDGRILSGRHGWAGEIGHVCVDPRGPQCRCGSTGCLELFAGRTAILEAAGLTESAGTDELIARVRAADVRAVKAVDNAAMSLAVALSNAVNLLDVQTVVLGGHLAHIGDLIAPSIETAMRRRVLSARWARPQVRAHGSNESIGATGAALTQLTLVIDDPDGWINRRG